MIKKNSKYDIKYEGKIACFYVQLRYVPVSFLSHRSKHSINHYRSWCIPLITDRTRKACASFAINKRRSTSDVIGQKREKRLFATRHALYCPWNSFSLIACNGGGIMSPSTISHYTFGLYSTYPPLPPPISYLLLLPPCSKRSRPSCDTK